MKSKLILIGLSLIVLLSCDFSKSVNKDLVTGLTTWGDGLSCEEVYLSDGDKVIKRNSFVYGESFFVYFDGIDGFTRVGDAVFPGMSLVVKSDAGETVLEYEDLYESYSDGMTFSPLVLNTVVTAASPMVSKGNYNLKIKIWDKKGEGTFEAKLDFQVVSNDKIKIESKGVSHKEIYLYSQERGKTITGNQAYFDENIYMIFEGLEGFTQEAGNVYPGLSITALDGSGVNVIDEADLIGDSGMNAAEFMEQLAPSMIFNSTGVTSPVTCDIIVWDKKGSNSIKAKVTLELDE